MNDAELRDLLREASGANQPSDDFVESLWGMLDSMKEMDGKPAPARHTTSHVTSGEVGHRESDRWSGRKPDRVRSGPVVALAAAAAVLLVGLLGALLTSIGEPGRVALAPAPTEAAEEAPPVTVGDAVDEGSLSPIVRECDRLLVDTRVAAVLRPGVVTEATSYRPSRSVVTDVSAIELRSLVQAIEQLRDTDGVRHDVRARHALSSATAALDQAILLIEMGEPTLAHESIHEAKTALGQLASESALDGCLETVS